MTHPQKKCVQMTGQVGIHLACTKLDTEFFWKNFGVTSAKIFQIKVFHFTLVTELILGGMISSCKGRWFRHSHTGMRIRLK